MTVPILCPSPRAARCQIFYILLVHARFVYAIWLIECHTMLCILGQIHDSTGDCSVTGTQNMSKICTCSKMICPGLYQQKNDSFIYNLDFAPSGPYAAVCVVRQDCMWRVAQARIVAKKWEGSTLSLVRVGTTCLSDVPTRQLPYIRRGHLNRLTSSRCLHTSSKHFRWKSMAGWAWPGAKTPHAVRQSARFSDEQSTPNCLRAAFQQ